jgi:hypothetical protein
MPTESGGFRGGPFIAGILESWKGIVESVPGVLSSGGLGLFHGGSVNMG